jgi:hypothetical protein
MWQVDVTTPAGMFLGMRFLISGYPYLVLVSRGSEVRVYEQIKGSRTQHAIVTWISSGHKQVKQRGWAPPAASVPRSPAVCLPTHHPVTWHACMQVQPKSFLSPMAPWWRALYGYI